MSRYVIPRNKRRHLIVSQDVHDAVRAYAACGEVSLVEATYQLLRLGFWASRNAEISDEVMAQHRIKRPRAFDPRSWFRRSSE